MGYFLYSVLKVLLEDELNSYIYVFLQTNIILEK